LLPQDVGNRSQPGRQVPPVGAGRQAEDLGGNFLPFADPGLYRAKRETEQLRHLVVGVAAEVGQPGSGAVG
jgi:hypothetical protein